MPAGSVPCSDCGQPVPADRVSCPNCGALMSAAAGALVESVAAASGDKPIDPGEELGGGGVEPAGPIAGGAVPGAYMPPTTVHRPVLPPEPPPTMPLAASPSVGVPPPAPTAGWSPPTPALVPHPKPPVQAGRASLFADLPFDAPDSVTEWLVAVGSGLATLSFLLPWISGTTSYDTSWGLASISRLPILALLLITAVLAILPNRVALWVRAGILGLIAGSLFVGNLWPIVAGDFGDAAFGAVIGTAAGIVLIAGGILAVAPRKTPATE